MGTAALRIVRAPFESPDPPSPAIALPMINMLEDWATPHSKEPSSNRPRKVRKVYC